MTLNLKSTFPLAFLGVLIFVVIRLWSGGGDPSYFIVAGSEFVHDGQGIHVNDGPGYDGQFFYRYAMDPSGKKDVGLRVDHPAYRHQRILYPLLVYGLSFGQSAFVPSDLILVNAIALILCILILERWFRRKGIPVFYAFIPLLLSGSWMGLGRDLAEPVELMFLALFWSQVDRGRTWVTVLSAAACLFTRESSVILILPAILALAWEGLGKKRSAMVFIRLLPLALPFLAFACWKYALFVHHHSPSVVEGGNNLTLPFWGMIQGFKQNAMLENGWRDVLELSIWLMHFSWNAWLFITVISTLRKENDLPAYFHWAWWTGLCLALLFSASIYNDDWSFARVLTGFNLLSMIILLHVHKKLNKYFLFYTFALAATTVLRLWVRP